MLTATTASWLLSSLVTEMSSPIAAEIPRSIYVADEFILSSQAPSAPLTFCTLSSGKIPESRCLGNY